MSAVDDVGGESGNAELLALHRLDETCTRLQQQGNYLEALETMERGLVLRQHFFGPSSDEVWKACKTVGEMCNLLAMTYLQQEDFPMVLELLKKAEILTERDDKGRAVTYNNLACYYRRQGKLHAALQYLTRALKVEQRLVDVENRADTHLNLCAVLSQLGRHAGALEHAQSALILLQEELFPGAGISSNGEQKTVGVDRIAVLAIAYHNIGVEQEFLKRFEMAIESYRKGVEISEAHLGDGHGITQTLRNSYLAAKKALSAREGTHGKGDRRTGRGARIGKSRNKRASQSSRVKSPQAMKKDEERWTNIQQAYGEVALGVKPAPSVSESYNLHEPPADQYANEFVEENEEEEQGQQKILEEPEIPKIGGGMLVVQDDKIADLITPRDESAIACLENEKENEEKDSSEREDTDASADDTATDNAGQVPQENAEEFVADDQPEEKEEMHESKLEDPSKLDNQSDETKEDLDYVEEKQANEQVQQDDIHTQVEEQEQVGDQAGTRTEDYGQVEAQDESNDAAEQATSVEHVEQDKERPLPSGWSEQFSKSKKKPYFFNQETGRSVWSRDEVFVHGDDDEDDNIVGKHEEGETHQDYDGESKNSEEKSS